MVRNMKSCKITYDICLACNGTGIGNTNVSEFNPEYDCKICK